MLTTTDRKWNEKELGRLKEKLAETSAGKYAAKKYEPVREGIRRGIEEIELKLDPPVGSREWAEGSVHAQVEDLDDHAQVEVLQEAAVIAAGRCPSALMPTFWNDRGRPWRVRLVRVGDRYGLNDCLTHTTDKGDGDQPLVEFYDGSSSPDKFGGRGQFVSRYNVGTLLGWSGCYGSGDLDRTGLCLNGGIDGWSVDAAVMTQVFRWLATFGYTAAGGPR